MEKNFNYRYLTYDGMTKLEQNIIVSSSAFNGLLLLDEKKENVECIGAFPNEPILKDTLHHKQYRYADKIFFMPDHAKNIHYYDVEKKIIGGIEFRKSLGCEDPIRGTDSFVMNEYCWIFFSYSNNPIIKFNMETCTIEKKIFLSDCLPDEIKGKGVQIFNAPMWRKGNKIYAAVWRSHYIFEFDMEKEKCQFIDLNCDIKMTSITGGEEGEFYGTIWKSGDIIHILLKEKKAEILSGPFLQDAISYCCIVNVEGKVYLLPNHSRDIYYILGKHLVLYMKLPKGFDIINDIRKNWRSFFSYTIEGEKIIACPYATNMGIIFDTEKKWIEKVNNSLAISQQKKIEDFLNKSLLLKELENEKSKKDFMKFIKYSLLR